MTWTDAEISKVARQTKIIQNEDHGDQQEVEIEPIEFECYTCSGSGSLARQINDKGDCEEVQCEDCFGRGRLHF